MIKKIDIHQHYYADGDKFIKTLQKSKELCIETICMSNIDEEPLNTLAKEKFDKHPEIIGMGFVRLGFDKPEIVDELYTMGFKGLKVIRPLKNYNDKEYMGFYERAEHYNMPVLFHTGVILSDPKADKLYDTDTTRMKPEHLDYIARQFPKLKIIGAHLGVPWYNDACGIAYRHENMYFDLSGAVNSLFDRPDWFFKTLTYWDGAKDKFLFGTDSYPEDMQDAVDRFEIIMDKLDFDQNLREKIYYKNAEKIFNLK